MHNSLMLIGGAFLLTCLLATMAFPASGAAEQQINKITIESPGGTIRAWSEGEITPVQFVFDKMNLRKIAEGNLPSAFDKLDLNNAEKEKMIAMLRDIVRQLGGLCTVQDDGQDLLLLSDCFHDSPLNGRYLGQYASQRWPESGYKIAFQNGGKWDIDATWNPWSNCTFALIEWVTGYPPVYTGWSANHDLHLDETYAGNVNSFCVLTNQQYNTYFQSGGAWAFTPCSKQSYP